MNKLTFWKNKEMHVVEWSDKSLTVFYGLPDWPSYRELKIWI